MFKVDYTTINVCKMAYKSFVGDGLYIGLFFIAILYFVMYMKIKDKKDLKIKIIFGIYSIIILFLNLNPLFTKLIINLLKENITYWRVYWLLPVGISIALMFTKIIFEKKELRDKIIAFVIIVCIIIMSGKYMYSDDSEEKFEKINNFFKVPDNVLDIIYHVSADENDYKKLVGNEQFIIYTRQIDGTIELPVGRNMEGNYENDSIVTLINDSRLKEVCDYCVENDCNYVVLKKGDEFINEYIIGYRISKLYENSEYSLYKFNNMND